MRHFLLMIAVVMGQPVLAAEPLTKEESAKVIEAAIRKELKKPTGELTKADLEKVTKLNLSFSGVTDISDLAELKQLMHLTLNGNQLTDISPLAELKQLKELRLSENKLTDVSPLAGLIKLKTLALVRNQITYLSPLAGLTQLTLPSAQRKQIHRRQCLGRTHTVESTISCGK